MLTIYFFIYFFQLQFVDDLNYVDVIDYLKATNKLIKLLYIQKTNYKSLLLLICEK